MTALMYASYKGNDAMIEYLLLHGANVNSDLHKDLVSVKIQSFTRDFDNSSFV